MPKNKCGTISTGKPGSASGSTTASPAPVIIVVDDVLDDEPWNEDADDEVDEDDEVGWTGGSDSSPSRRPTDRPRLKPEPNALGPLSSSSKSCWWRW